MHSRQLGIFFFLFSLRAFDLRKIAGNVGTERFPDVSCSKCIRRHSFVVVRSAATDTATWTGLCDDIWNFWNV